MLDALVRIGEILAPRWGLDPRRLNFVSRSENCVFSITAADGQVYFLRVLRAYYNSKAQLLSEQKWIQHLHRSGRLQVPLWAPSSSGHYLHSHRIDGETIYVNLCRGLAGDEVNRVYQEMSTKERTRYWVRLGELIATLHSKSDDLFKYSDMEDFTRRHWDLKALLGKSPTWGKFRDIPLLDTQQKELINQTSERAISDLQRYCEEDDPDYGLIHCDLIPRNILYSNADDQIQLAFIDFDDGGFGYRVYDLMVALFHLYGSDDFDRHRSDLWRGYHSTRQLVEPSAAIEHAWMLTRALSLLGWSWRRFREFEDSSGVDRRLERALTLSQQYLDRHGR